MSERPYVVVSCATSLDGYIDTECPPRLVLSNDSDFDRVDEVRSQCDVILVGASTVRRDNPRLLVRSLERRERREAAGRSATPWKATVTLSGNLDGDAAFFTLGDTAKFVYCTDQQAPRLTQHLGAAATVVPLGREVSMSALLADLGARGAQRVLIEGGGKTLTQVLEAGLVDELMLTIAPFFVGNSGAPRFVGDGAFPWTSANRARLVESRPVGDVVLLRYAMSDRFGELAARTPPARRDAPADLSRI